MSGDTERQKTWSNHGVDYETLTEEVGEWARENFGHEQPPEFPLIGSGEEAGELTRSVLKRAQGIDDAEKYEQRDDVGPEAERDAIGDVVIYSMDFLHRYREAVESDEGRRPPEAIEHLIEFYIRFGEACWFAIHGGSRHGTESHLFYALDALNDLAEERGYDFERCVADAWEEVSGREFNAEIETRG